MKQQVRDLLVNRDYQGIVELAGKKRRVLSFLTALTYDSNPLISWRAVEGIGLAAGRIADDDPEFVRHYLLRLLWLLNDESGGIGWRSAEAVGEIVRTRPEQFAQFMPIVAALPDMEPEDAIRFRPGMLWAIGRLAQIRPAEMRPALPWVLPCLTDANPQTRGLAAWCLGQLGLGGHLTGRDELLADEGPVELYADGRLVRTSVSQLAREALAGS